MTSPNYLLAIETSGQTASVALLRPDGPQAELVSESQVPAGQRSAKLLVPTLQDLLKTVGTTPSEVATVAVAAGPGSFTGLRVGVTTAKTFAYASGCKLVAVNTLDVLAHQAFDAHASAPRVWAVLDAQREQFFAACYDSPAAIGVEDRTELLALEAWLARLEAGDLVVGPVATKYADALPASVSIANPDANIPRARSVGQLAAKKLAAGETCDPFALVPEYHRLSAAEEKARGAKQ